MREEDGPGPGTLWQSLLVLARVLGLDSAHSGLQVSDGALGVPSAESIRFSLRVTLLAKNTSDVHLNRGNTFIQERQNAGGKVRAVAPHIANHTYRRSPGISATHRIQMSTLKA
eukprot:212545-Hanusia_phi.AAC.1